MTKYVMLKANLPRPKLYGMIIGAALTTAFAMSACATKPERDVSGKHAVVESLAVSLEENFVFPKIGAKYAKYLRNNPLQNIGEMPPAQFALSLTSGLQHVHKDAHLRVIPPNDIKEQNNKKEPNNTKEEMQEVKKTSSLAPKASIEATMWLVPNIAYIRFNLFPGDTKTLQTLNTFIKTHENAKTLIIDVRGHRGGGLAEMDMMFSHMFSEATDLAYMETRQAVDDAGASPVKDGKTVKTIKGPKGVVRRKHMAIPHSAPLMLDTEIYILTSGYTASAAEHLSMVMKRTKRGVVVGEHTRGGAHYGGTVDLENGYAAFVPVGRTFNPDTQKDWEGVGVAPDIKTSSEQALVEVLLNIGMSEADALNVDRLLNYTPPARPE